MPTMTLKPEGADQPVQVSLNRSVGGDECTYSVSVADARMNVRIEPAGDGAGLLHVNGRIESYHAVRTNGIVHVWLGGRTYRFELIQRAARRAGGAATAARRSDLTAPMPGTVLKVLVARGERFAAHAPLVVMESMKMEMTLSAPHPGRVREIECRTGQLVAMGAVLMRFDEDGNGGDA